MMTEATLSDDEEEEEKEEVPVVEEEREEEEEEEVIRPPSSATRSRQRLVPSIEQMNKMAAQMSKRMQKGQVWSGFFVFFFCF